MKLSLEDLLAGVPAQDGNGGELLKPNLSAKKKANEPVTQLDKTTTNAKRVLEDEAEARAVKTARLKSAREERDASEAD
ncbi:hypothetical protein [Seohaeicola zhoushanensis]|uniref:Uncharacterized protein n=1 Tax=Seohaeicola zhoushanensis TaxID=1569283 RepID=A0A8J3H0E0_9RHOB|nr:hypothetical protein [Seohaeicola zhoushanensis]GHF66366.1 hypothetical protein GCM10017056_41940 [Seohaeicola zhoushanensis]